MEKVQPEVSVIISCYNHEKYIRACVDSVLGQTYRPVELLVYDDGSTDRSAEILGELSREHGFFFQAQSNIGYTATLNQGIARARGKYIALLGSDDLFLPDKLAKQVAFMESRQDIAACGGSILNVDADGQIIAKQRFQPYHEMDFEQLFQNRKLAPPAPTALIRTEVLREIGGYDPGIRLEDLYMWLKLTSRGYRLAVLNDVLVYYRLHDSNTHKDNQYMIENICRIYEEYSRHESYEKVMQHHLIASFLRMSKKNRRYAIGLLGKIKPSYYNLRVLRGIFHCLLPI